MSTFHHSPMHTVNFAVLSLEIHGGDWDRIGSVVQRLLAGGLAAPQPSKSKAVNMPLDPSQPVV